MTLPTGLDPHDLIWGFGPQHLPEGSPEWAYEALCVQPPVVLRRDVARPGWLPVGIRGAGREQRLGAWMPLAAITRVVQPEELCLGQSCIDWPAMQALRALRRVMNQSGLVWGVAGSAGFELASGLPALHADSDLDLILRCFEPLSRCDASRLLLSVRTPLCAVDVQLQTPAGAVSLVEWAGPACRVLLKANEGARLVSDPWCSAGQIA